MEDLEHIAFKNHYVKSVNSISGAGLYWFTDTSQIAHIVTSLMIKAGYKVQLCEIAPRWEFVIYETDKFNFDELTLIAKKRHEAWEFGCDEDTLPKT